MAAEDAMVDRPVAVPTIGVMREQAEVVATQSGELLCAVRDIVKDAVGEDSRPPDEISKEPIEPALPAGLIGLTRTHLSVIERNLVEIRSELDRL